MNRNIKLILAFGAMTLIAACGGGGGTADTSTSTVTSTESFMLKAAIANSNQAGANNVTINGFMSGVAITGSGSVTRGSLSAGTFEGTSLFQQTITTMINLTVSGVTVPFNDTTVYWYDSNNIPIGESDGDEYTVVNGTPIIPTTVKVNDTGIMYTANRYSDSTKATLLGTSSVSYVIQADTATTALLKLINKEIDTNGDTVTYTQLSRITPAGTNTTIKRTVEDGADSINVVY
jgi:hypothetical protein